MRSAGVMSNYGLSEWVSKIPSKEQREEALNKEWLDLLPCKTCPICEMCKHVGTLKRLNFDSDVWDLNITCKKKGKIKVLNND